VLTFLFWNLKTRNASTLASLARAHHVDIIILAECPVLPGDMLVALNRGTADYSYAQSGCHKINLYTRFSDQFVLPVMDTTVATITGDDYSLRRVALPGGRQEFLLCAVHFSSKLWQTPGDQTAFAFPFARRLARAEEAVKHQRTLLVGDLNMNPYEDGVVMTQGLHATPSRRIARRERRTVKFESNLHFYNPMWAHFGEKSQGHAGTYYYPSPKARADHWNIYDQVLVRPALLDHFRDEDVEVLHRDQATNTSLLSADGTPDARFSDHLPILFRLHI
jgi:hypothetical protein